MLLLGRRFFARFQVRPRLWQSSLCVATENWKTAPGGPLPFPNDAGRQVSCPTLPSTPSQGLGWITRSPPRNPQMVYIMPFTLSAVPAAKNANALAGPANEPRFERLAPFS